MSRIYEINEKIEALLDGLEPDPETGEVADQNDILARLEALNMEKAEKLTNCARAYFEAAAQADACKAEAKRLTDKAKSADSKANRILSFLDFISNGEELDCGVATLKHPKPRASLKVTDATAAVNWFVKEGRYDLYSYGEPKLDANSVKQLLMDDVQIPGVELEYKAKAVLK